MKLDILNNQLCSVSTDKEELILPDGIVSIKHFCFTNGTKTTGSKIPNVKKIRFPSSLEYIANLSGLHNVDEFILPENVNRIGNCCFQYASPIKIDLSKTKITEIPIFAFYCCGRVEEILLPPTLKKIHKYAFSNCKKLKSIVIPNSVTSMEGDIFSFCSSLENITLSNKLRVIHEFTFNSCIKLEEIIIPKSVFKIKANAFYGCDNLKYINILNPKCNLLYQYIDSSSLMYARVTTYAPLSLRGCLLHDLYDYILLNIAKEYNENLNNFTITNLNLSKYVDETNSIIKNLIFDNKSPENYNTLLFNLASKDLLDKEQFTKFMYNKDKSFSGLINGLNYGL